MAAAPGMGFQQTTDYKVVLPFYAYAALSFLTGCILLFFNTDITQAHYFNPATLAITHTMALAWGTMMIFGASHQLLPVLIEGKLESKFLANFTFVTAAIGIPILIYGFYHFDPVNSNVLLTGGILVNLGVLSYVINVILSSIKSKKKSIHAWFVITASLWLFSTTLFGLLLVINFRHQFFTQESLSYLSIHGHMGLIGWFLMLILGVGSRLIPLFLISKYDNQKLLWAAFWLTNLALISFIIFKLYDLNSATWYISILMILAAVVCFGIFNFRAHGKRIRKKVDYQVKLSLLSVIFMLAPIISLIVILTFLPVSDHPNIPILYGFFIFFGWITAIILGMTFKTMPFIVWNMVYDKKKKAKKTLAPKDLFSEKNYRAMMVIYLTGLVLFVLGVLILNNILLKAGAIALIGAALLYVINVYITLTHKPEEI